MKKILLSCTFIMSCIYTYGQNVNPSTGAIDMKASLDITGGIMMQSLLSNKSIRPVISTSKIPGEIRVYSAAGYTADDGMLRLSAGAGSTPAVQSYIDISAYSTIPDMDRNIVFGTSGSEKMRISTLGNVSIGSPDARGYKLAVAGNMIAESVKVKLQGAWPDYVFNKDYRLPSLEETEKHIKEMGCLPGIPSAAEVKENGIEVGEMNAMLLRKIEELTLYLIEQKKELDKVKADNIKLNQEVFKVR